MDAPEGKVKKVTISGSRFSPNNAVTLYFFEKCFGVKVVMDFPLSVQVKGEITDKDKADDSGFILTALTKDAVNQLPEACFEPDQNVYTLKAVGLKGSVATAPLIWQKMAMKK
ncbi:MAG: hypothetical protein A2169_13590 [Deltaproteobacteria bacterium RBG_13_47_9]|nr:MAG: hypothetical protein A2169_13590 [Deltaproteobacteria bacterium RBG_13_47_9]